MQVAVALLSLALLASARHTPTEEDVKVRAQLRSTYSQLLSTAATVEVTRRKVGNMMAHREASELQGNASRLLKADPNELARTAEQLAIQAREAAGESPVSLAAAIPGKGPLAAYRRASTELVDAARAVSFLRRKVAPLHPNRAAAFVSKLMKEGEGEGEEEAPKTEREKLSDEVEETKEDLKEAEEALDESEEKEEETEKEEEETEELLDEAEEDHEFKEYVSDSMDGMWSLEEEPFADQAHADEFKAEDKLEESKENHEEAVEEHEKAKEEHAEAKVEAETAEEEHENAAEELHEHNEEKVEEAQAKAEAAEEKLKEAEEEQEEHEQEVDEKDD